LLVGDVLADRYELQELAGSGGMSTVFRAHDRVLERTVAVKVLHQRYNDEEDYVERFRREARMAAGLSHHNIVTVIDRGEHEDRQYIVFEYVDGDNLKELVDREGPLPIDYALSLGIQIATALAFAHAGGLVHRDVKPQNVLLNGDGTAKVTDFGIARSLDVGKGVTQTGTVLGTSDYIAPEQAQGQAVGERTDVYSLGVVLYELLTGELPFRGDNFMAIALKHINEPAPRVSASRPEVSQRLDDAIATALAKSPDARFARMADFRTELQACLAELRAGTGQPVELDDDGHATAVIPPPPKQRRRLGRRTGRRILAVLLVVLALALVTGAGWLVSDAWRSDGSGGKGNGGGSTSSGGPVTLTAVGTFDPPPRGDGHEHDEEVSLATDGNESTSWDTEEYHDPPAINGKPGVGLVLDAGSASSPAKITVTSDTPGFNAEIQAGDSAGGPFETVSSSQTVETRTTFELEDVHKRYFVVWITSSPPGGSAHINEVTASS
jgi:tRNA A-37 threonylcarbamoyl transferase component Bud32